MKSASKRQRNYRNEDLRSGLLELLKASGSGILRLLVMYIIPGIVVPLVGFFLWAHFIGFSFFGKDTEYVEIENAQYDQALTDWTYKNYDSAEENFLKAEVEMKDASGRDGRLQYAQLEQKLGALYIDMGHYEKCYDRLNSAYSAFRKLLGRRHTLTTLTLAQIAIYDLELGNYERALETYQEAFEDSTKAITKIKLTKMIAQTYTRLENYAKANECYSLICNLYISVNMIPFEVDPLLANEYGSLMLSAGRDDDAYECFSKVIEYWEENNGGENLSIALVFQNMAIACNRTEKLQDAVIYADRAFSIYEKVYNGKGLDLAVSYQVIGGLYDDIQETKKGQEYLEKALEIALAEVGQQHHIIAGIYRSLALHYSQLGNIQEAIRYNEEALEIQKTILQGETAEAATTYNNLCETYSSDGDYDKAIAAAQMGLAICEENASIGPKLKGNLYLQLAWPYAFSGQLDEALACVDKGVEIFEEQFSEASGSLAFAYRTKGRVYAELERYDEAEELIQKAFEIHNNVYGATRTPITNTYFCLAELYLEQERYDDAIIDYTKKLDTILALNPENHETLASLYHRIGFVFHKKEDYTSSLEYYETSINYRKKLIGPNDEDFSGAYEDLAWTYNNIAAIYEDKKEFVTAAEYSLEAYAIFMQHDISIKEDSLAFQRLRRLYDRLQPNIPFERWIRSKID